MRTVHLHATKTHFSRWVDEAAAGAEIIIAKAGKPVAKRVPLEPVEKRTQADAGRLGWTGEPAGGFRCAACG